MFPLHCIPEILYAESIDTGLIIHAKSFSLWPNAYPQYMDYWPTDRRTDRRQTDDNGIIDAYSVAVIKNASKILYSIGLIINVRKREFHANFDVENESCQKRKFQGTKVPGDECFTMFALGH